MSKLHRTLAYPIVKMCLKFVREETAVRIKQDIEYQSNETESFIKLLIIKLEGRLTFRNVFFWRLDNECCHSKHAFLLRKLIWCLRKVYPPLNSVEIYCSSGDIGGGLYVPHNYCVINAKKIGSNVSILQGATIGKGAKGGNPVIGDNVCIFSNAVVAGDIRIGNNVYIGANVFVNYDVPDNSTVKAPASTVSKYTESEKES